MVQINFNNHYELDSNWYQTIIVQYDLTKERDCSMWFNEKEEEIVQV
jgi:hypothetical protein